MKNPPFRITGYLKSTLKMIDDSSDVITSDADDVNDFTTVDMYFRIPTVTKPIATVLREKYSSSPLHHRQQRIPVEMHQRHLLRKPSTVPHHQTDEVEHGAPTTIAKDHNRDKLSQMFCWKMDTSFFPFISFSVITPEIPDNPDERIVRIAGRIGSSR